LCTSNNFCNYSNASQPPRDLRSLIWIQHSLRAFTAFRGKRPGRNKHLSRCEPCKLLSFETEGLSRRI
jgi:hypothetical protein